MSIKHSGVQAMLYGKESDGLWRIPIGLWAASLLSKVTNKKGMMIFPTTNKSIEHFRDPGPVAKHNQGKDAG